MADILRLSMRLVVNVMLRRRVLELIVVALFWLLLVFKTDPQDLAAGFVIGLLTAAGISIGSRHLHARYAVPSGWAAALVTLPWKIITDTGRVFIAFFRQIIRRDQTVGQLVTVPFDYGTQQPQDTTRLALTIFGISITPNTVAITTDSDGVVVHQLQPGPEPVERRDPKWPV